MVDESYLIHYKGNKPLSEEGKFWRLNGRGIIPYMTYWKRIHRLGWTKEAAVSTRWMPGTRGGDRKSIAYMKSLKTRIFIVQ